MRITVSTPASGPRLFSKNDIRNGAEGAVQGLYGRVGGTGTPCYLLKGPDFVLFIRPDRTMEDAAPCSAPEWHLIKPTNELNISIS